MLFLSKVTNPLFAFPLMKAPYCLPWADSTTMERPTVAFSAPGKVLLAGGYLVLDRKYTGLVCGLDARIHVHVQTLQSTPGLTLSEIVVKSPQFRDAEWRYGYLETEGNGGIEVTQLRG